MDHACDIFLESKGYRDVRDDVPRSHMPIVNKSRQVGSTSLPTFPRNLSSHLLGTLALFYSNNNVKYWVLAATSFDLCEALSRIVCYCPFCVYFNPLRYTILNVLYFNKSTQNEDLENLQSTYWWGKSLCQPTG